MQSSNLFSEASQAEQLIRLRDVGDLLPSSRRGARVSRGLLHRWITKGTHGVVLKSVRVGSAYFTTKRWLSEFVEEQTRSHRIRNGRDVTKEAPLSPSPSAGIAERELQQRFGL